LDQKRPYLSPRRGRKGGGGTKGEAAGERFFRNYQGEKQEPTDVFWAEKLLKVSRTWPANRRGKVKD